MKQRIFLITYMILFVIFTIQTAAAEEEDYDLDPRLYIYYAQLTEDERDVYVQALEEFSAGISSFAPCRGISLDSANRIMHAICKDQPQLFWLDESFQYSYRQGLSGSEKVTEISADFNSLADDL